MEMLLIIILSVNKTLQQAPSVVVVVFTIKLNNTKKTVG